MFANAELIAIAALGITLFIGGVGAAFALGNLPKRSEFNGLRKELTTKIQESHQELATKIEESHQEVATKIEESHKELKAEIRRSHQQVMRALINHRHLQPDGEPVFTELPDTELVAADD